MNDITYIVDLQFGSTGKGLIAGHLAKRREVDTIVTAWGPNAGHTYIGQEGVFVNIALPNGIVAPSVRTLLFGPGSIINPDIMLDEMKRYHDFIETKRIAIHEHAAIVRPHHRNIEASYAYKIGSTMKGVGAAVVNKIQRDPENLNIAGVALKGTDLEDLVVSRSEYQDLIATSTSVSVEGAQGYSLGINSGFYPYTTSRECTVAQLKVDCAIPGVEFYEEIVGVARTFPIRVANRFSADGKQIGTSGPCYPDQQEIEWAEIGVKPELTTVTKLPRRIFTWSDMQVKEAIRMNGVDQVFLNFCNYVCTKEELYRLQKYADVVLRSGARINWYGFGPSEADIVEV